MLLLMCVDPMQNKSCYSFQSCCSGLCFDFWESDREILTSWVGFWTAFLFTICCSLLISVEWLRCCRVTRKTWLQRDNELVWLSTKNNNFLQIVNSVNCFKSIISVLSSILVLMLIIWKVWNKNGNIFWSIPSICLYSIDFSIAPLKMRELGNFPQDRCGCCLHFHSLNCYKCVFLAISSMWKQFWCNKNGHSPTNLCVKCNILG